MAADSQLIATHLIVTHFHKIKLETMVRCSLALLLIASATVTEAFFTKSIAFRPRSLTFAAEKESESAFVPIEAEDESDETFEKVEMLGKGAAKVGTAESQWRHVVLHSCKPSLIPM